MNRELSSSTESLLSSRTRSLFANLDRDGSGYIEQSELADYCGADISEAEFARLFSQLDKDGDGRISLDDFREGFRVISQTVHRRDQERRRSSVASILSTRLQSSSGASQENSLNELDEEPEAEGAESKQQRNHDDHQHHHQMMAESLSDCLQSLSCQDHVLDLYQQLSDQQQKRPHLLESFETVLAELIQSIRTLQTDQTRMEESMRQERERHRRAVRDLEAELEHQVTAAEEAALARAKEVAERDYRAVLEAKDAELTGLMRQLEEHRKRLSATDQLGAEVSQLRRELEASRTERKLAQSELIESETRLAVAMSDISSLKQTLQEREFKIARERETVQDELRQRERIAQQLQAMHAANRELRDRNEELMQVAMDTALSSPTSNGAPASLQPQQRDLNDVDEDSEGDDAGRHSPTTARRTVIGGFPGASSVAETVHDAQTADAGGGGLDFGHHRSHRKSPLRVAEATPPQRRSLGSPERMFKVVLAGDSSVGKSCFIMRLCDNKFVEKTTATLGVDFKTKVLCVDDRLLAVQLWDTAGQERFRSIAKSYFRRADGVLLLYDCTHERSFISVRDWLSQVREVADVPIMICGNKIDLRPDEADQAQQPAAGGQPASRCIGYAEARKLAQEHDALFAETSAKSGENVEQSVAELARQMRANEDLQLSQAHLRSADSVRLTPGGSGNSKRCCDS